jgi:ribonuclease PH
LSYMMLTLVTYIEKAYMHSHDTHQARRDVRLHMRARSTQTRRRRVHALGPLWLKCKRT